MRSLIRRAGLAVAVSVLVFASGCTVRPLLATGPASQNPAALDSVAIAPVNTRPAQEVRNHLIFLFGGGSGQPENPDYILNLAVTSRASSAAEIQRAGENEPTAGMVTLTGDYRLEDTETGDVVASGKRQISSAFDRPRQEFARLRAERDAENRAARELAELLRLTVAQDITRLDAR
ncbi:LPS assembly lipoprotein LptE [Chelativorans sp. YIM 93263]|uniref:LPS assembly lipoprotein LptE n=1 Tax=Chelativorans sp. YIM 93263 TaxID=2906648 RepID=UPI002378B8A1|nr:LPS assembly lipoprotein LptE [Chelativorans sp. YIM 93263]